MKLLCLLGSVVTASFLAGCNYDAALTAKPTQKAEARLLGNWFGGDDGKDQMNVRLLDASTYVVAFDDDIYRVTHSDFGGTPFLSVESLQPGVDYGKYVYLTWTLTPDGSQLTLRTVSTKVIPEGTKGRAALQKLIKANVAHPALLGDPIVFTRQKPQ